MKIGYIRSEQKDDFYTEQQNHLINEGCERIFEDLGENEPFKELFHLTDFIRNGDTVCVHRMDRFGLNVKELMKFIHDFLQRNIHIKSLKEGIDTSTQEGKIFLKIFNVLGMCEQNAISENTNSIIQNNSNVKPMISPQFRKPGGRPAGLNNQAKEKADAAASMYQDGQMSMREIANALEISTATLYSYLRHKKVI